MDDEKYKKLSFKDFMVVDYLPGTGEYISYQAHKRHSHQGAGTDAEYASYQPEGDQLDEALSNAQRLKVSQRMKRLSKKMAVARQRSMKKAPSSEQIKKRANKQARNLMKMKMTKGVPSSELSMGQRAELEKKMAKKKGAIDKLARKLQFKIRKDDQERRKKSRMTEDADGGMDRQQRIKTGQRMKRLSKRIQIAKKKAMKRAPTSDVIDKRARRQARNQLSKQLGGGKSKSDMAIGKRKEVEKKVKKQSQRLDSLTKRLRPQVRKQDRDRRASANKAD